MRNLARILTLMLIIVVISVSVLGCSQKGADSTKGTGSAPSKTASTTATSTTANTEIPENFNAAGFPIVNTPITLTAFGGKHAMHGDWEDMLVLKEYEKMTNISIKWDLVPQENVNERLTIKSQVLKSEI
jgi:putative aldouronate transport system substrate-binding protein